MGHPSRSVTTIAPEDFFTTLSARYATEPPLALRDPWWTLVAIMLSARTKDATVLHILPGLIGRATTATEVARLSVEELEQLLFTVSFHRVKARHLQRLAATIAALGRVPRQIDELERLPGVGKKTARVFLGKQEQAPVIGVDVHVHRISQRIGWVKKGSSLAHTEEQLLKRIPSTIISAINPLFVRFGRTICLPRQPLCAVCPFRVNCPSASTKLSQDVCEERAARLSATEQELDLSRERLITRFHLSSDL